MRSLKLSLYIAIFSLTQLYLPSVVEYNTTCFGPLCGPSSGVTYRLSYTMCIGGGGRDLFCVGGVFLMQCKSRFCINLLYTAVAHGVSCFCLYSKLHSLG